ncbi:probable 28S ribosomal protein S10, mitochondrial [Pristis pectinata]|uniref:probable 28S ribosomal protein S10, mitochondrial n=1 Tax=Pristis pectinata TaxID=685728 RepID=UPI00223CCFE7|nr:probable 28S ribosomal protein S10, mitochondrial [Pristis pectinata]
MAAVARAACGVFRRLLRVDRVPLLNYAANNMIAVCLCRKRPLPIVSSRIHWASSHYSTVPLITVTDDLDILYKKICVLVKGHDKMVLDSYEYFATLAAKELNITVDKVYEPPRKIDRLTLLKSIHIFKKHRVQYEMRTHYRCIELKHLTGSTADVYLEYIQRNLPEGVAMEVTKTRLEKLPDHLKEPIWSAHSQDEGKPV